MSGSFAASRADPYLREKDEELKMSQELDLGESAAASAGAGAGSSSTLKRSHSASAAPKEANDKRKVIFQKIVDTLYRNWDTEGAEALSEKGTKPASAAFTVRSGPSAIGKTVPSLMGAPPPSDRAVGVSGYKFREPTDPRLEKAYRTVMVVNREFIKNYIADNFKVDDFMGQLLTDIAYASKFDAPRARALEAIYGVLDQAEREVADMDKKDLAVYRAMMAQNALNALTAKGFGGGGRSIYTLRAKRRNVRNKAQRRTRKGLVRQGSRAHRKTRRGSGARKPHGRRPKGL